ncbi:MAG: hypothetical protein KM312_08860 [Hydrogenibacillus schlegelii]|uniref:Uncharacterized protein n=1 Tax=Hydrogenibacillus schlegelii TaxID=1484 RepID=A0A947CYG2_HYDSH|nr:hypothetical protein [Hydrogenibacillus schlegelii]
MWFSNEPAFGDFGIDGLNWPSRRTRRSASSVARENRSRRSRTGSSSTAGSIDWSTKKAIDPLPDLVVQLPGGPAPLLHLHPHRLLDEEHPLPMLPPPEDELRFTQYESKALFPVKGEFFTVI